MTSGLMNERELEAIKLAHAVGFVTVGTLAVACPGWSSETYRLALMRLVGDGVLVATGQRRGRRYCWPSVGEMTPMHKCIELIFAHPEHVDMAIMVLEREGERRREGVAHAEVA